MGWLDRLLGHEEVQGRGGETTEAELYSAAMQWSRKAYGKANPGPCHEFARNAHAEGCTLDEVYESMWWEEEFGPGGGR
ncbi:MAG TPA: hypothetical protein VGE42_09850 [Candidatus Dormibacteraeota bacterium]